MKIKRNRSSQSGFTLIEMMIVMALLLVIMGAVFSQISIAQKRASTEQQKMDLFQETREFLDTMTRDLRNAGYPNSRNLDPGTLGTANTNARGLMYLGPADVWFEGAVDGDGIVYLVKYHLDSSGTNCPCLRRSKVQKATSGMTDNYSVEVQFVQNGSMTNPIFSYYDSSNTLLDLSSYTGNVIDGTNSATSVADLAKIASIQTIKMQLSSQAKYADLQTNQKPIITLNSYVTLNNCSQATSAGTLSC